MYTESDLAAVKAQQKKRWLILCVPAAVALAGTAASVAVRIEWLTSLLTIVLGVILIAGYELFIRPLHCYQTHIEGALHGRTRVTEGTFRSLSEEVSVVDGVRYRSMTILDKTPEGEPCDRLFYYDVEKPFPEMAEGTPVRVVFHDREVADLTVLQGG